jgi:AAA family ATP:ADP antiporter
VLESFRDVRPDERRGAFAAFLCLFGILASHTLLETARDALFLARLPATQLPFVYLAMAAIAVGLSQGPWRRSFDRVAGPFGLSLLLVVLSAGSFGFWSIGAWDSPWLLRALYVWTGVVITLATLRFWLILGERYTLTQAKRLFRLVGTGSLLGAVSGAVLARLIAAGLSTDHLVLASAAVLALTGLGPALLLRRPVAGASSRPPSLLQAVRLLRTQPYVRGLAGLVLVSSVTLTLVDYVFKSAVAGHVAPERLGVFFATVYGALSLLAIVVQLLLMGWLLRALGLHRALCLLPILLGLGALGVALGGGIVAALLLKGSDGALRQSLHRTSSELLFVPLPDSLRARAKPLIDVVGQRGGQALASVVILSELVLRRSEATPAIAVVALALVWIILALGLREHYLDLFRAALREGTLRESASLADLDLASLEALFAALNSRDDAEVIGAMDLLAAGGRVRLIPALILFHPSRRVVLRTLELFAESDRTDFTPVAERLLDHADPEIRASALRVRASALHSRTSASRGRASTGHEEALLEEACSDPHPLVRATALVGLATRERSSEQALAELEALVASKASGTRLAVATAIRLQPAAVFERLLLRLAEAVPDEAHAQTALAMGAVGSERFLWPLVEMLGLHEARREARLALRGYGARGVRFLEEALADQALPHEIRRHIPRSLTVFAGELAVPVLLKRLLEEPDGMVRFKALRALGRIATQQPEVAIEAGVLRQAAARTLEAAFRLVHWRLLLEQGARRVPSRATPGHELLATLFRDKEIHATERLFRLLALIFRGEDFKRIYRGLMSSKPKTRASSRELVENLLEPPLRDGVLALVDDEPDAERLARARPYYVPRLLAYEDLLATILEYPSETLRSIVAYHIGELGLVRLRPRLEAFKPHDTGFFVARVIEKSLLLLTPRSGPASDAS